MGMGKAWLRGLLLAGLAWGGVALAQQRSVDVDVGGQALVIPLPADYRLMSDEPVFMQAMSGYLPAGLRLLAVAMHGDDVDAALMAAEKHPYYFYAVPERVQGLVLDDTTWAGARPLIEAQMRSIDLEAAARPLLEKGNRALSDQLGERIEVGAGLSQKQVVWIAPDGSVRMTAVMPGRLQVADQQTSYLQDAGIAMLPVRKRLVAIYAYRTRAAGERGSDAIRATLDAALEALKRANATPGPTASAR